MKHPRDQLLAGAGLAFDKRGRARRRDPPNHRDQLAALGRLGDEAGGDTGDVELLAQLAVLALQRAHLDRASDDGVQFVVVERLGDAIECATAERRLGRLCGRQRHAHHNRHIRVLGVYLLQQVHPIHPRHPHVCDDYVCALIFEQLEGCFDVRTGFAIVTSL